LAERKENLSSSTAASAAPSPRHPADRVLMITQLSQIQHIPREVREKLLIPWFEKDKVSGVHLEDAIETWLIEHNFANNTHESFVLESA
jgi:hypothetical protein